MNTKQATGVKKSRVLVAGANNPLFIGSAAFFPAEDYDVFFARDGCQAYGLAKQILPSIVFLDRSMPVLDGEECCRLIKGEERLKATCVVLVTEDADSKFRQARHTKADMVICKPLNQQRFPDLLSDLLEKYGRNTGEAQEQEMFIELPNLNKT